MYSLKILPNYRILRINKHASNELQHRKTPTHTHLRLIKPYSLNISRNGAVTRPYRPSTGDIAVSADKSSFVSSRLCRESERDANERFDDWRNKSRAPGLRSVWCREELRVLVAIGRVEVCVFEVVVKRLLLKLRGLHEVVLREERDRRESGRSL